MGGVEVLSSRDEYDNLCETDAVRILGVVEKDAVEIGVACDARRIVDEQTWQAIIDAAERKKCDLIHMGSHGRSGFTALLLGSQTQKVLTHSKIPVLVYR